MFSPNQRLLYRLFLSYPEREFYMQEIGRILGKKPGVFQRTLNQLEESGFVVSEFKANARFFRLNTQYEILDEIRSILTKTSNKLNLFQEKIKKLDLQQKKRRQKRASETKTSSKKLLALTNQPLVASLKSKHKTHKEKKDERPDQLELF